jgi:Ni,Fe-hydrogenase III large subunit/Ni,Fe-hydrogenase III component G
MTYSEIITKYIPKTLTPEKHTNLILFQVPSEEIIAICKELYDMHKLRLKTIKATDERKKHEAFKIFYVFGIPDEKFFLVPYISLKNITKFPSLVGHIHEATMYEREIHTFFGLTPVGHPDLRPFILHENWPANMYPLRKDFQWRTRPEMAHESYEFQKVSGEGIYEIPVGPIHAGIIEPGHFRFSVAGEEIIALEPKLGYVHKGSEKLFETLSLPDKVKLAERISGDTSFSHSLAFCQAVETLGNITIPKRAKYLRVIFSELERLANHFNDIGFILNDTAFGGSNGTRLREHIMQLCKQITNHRFLRGVNIIGGVTKDISSEVQKLLQTTLPQMQKDFEEIITITEDAETVMNRLQKTGILDKQIAQDHGVVGIAARALGLHSDARIEHPYAAYEELPVKMAKQTTGDVYARYWIRIAEVYNAIEIILQAIKKLPLGNIVADTPIILEKNTYTIGITEGWRGDIVYFVATDSTGKIDRVGVRDASFLNWPAVPYALPGNIVPDFPLINKSFNLSYSGFDR